MGFGTAFVLAFGQFINLFRDRVNFSMCTRYGDPINVLSGDVIHESVDLVDLFEKSKKVLGRGTFGVVKQVDLEMPQHLQVAIKRIRLNPEHFELIANELSILNDIKNPRYFPALIACIEHERFLYIVQELIKGSQLAVEEKNKSFNKSEPVDTFPLIHQGFKAIESLFEKNIRHNDIKPANVLLDRSRKRIYFIDFGVAEYIHSPLKYIDGTPGFISPGRFSKNEPTFLDDMYSWVITLALIFGGDKKLFNERRFIDQKQLKLSYLSSDECFKQTPTNHCRNVLMKNIGDIFCDAGFGEPTKETSQAKINLTSLLVQIVKYDDFIYSLPQVMSILKRIKSEIQDNPTQFKNLVDTPISHSKWNSEKKLPNKKNVYTNKAVPKPDKKYQANPRNRKFLSLI